MRILTLLLLLLPLPAFVDTVHYTFAGENLGGSLILDADTPFAVTVTPTSQGDMVVAELRSPLNRISGTWSGLPFEGDAYLSIFDAPNLSIFGADHWIVRANIPSVNFTGLNLFIYRSPGTTTPPSLTPPSHNVNRFDFQYTIGFTDESFIAAPLTDLSIVSVPEPCSSWLLTVGLLAFGIWRRR